MTDKAIGEAIGDWINTLRLSRWTVSFEAPKTTQLDTDGRVAIITPSFQTWVADLAIAGDRTKDEILHSIRHEMLHLLLADWAHIHRETAERLGHDAAGIANRLAEDAEECIVIQLERAFQHFADEAAK